MNHENSHSINIWVIYSPVSSSFLTTWGGVETADPVECKQSFSAGSENNWRVLQSSAWKWLLKILQFVCQNASVTVTHLFHTSLMIPGSLGWSFVVFYATGCSFHKNAVVSLYCTSFASTFISLPTIAVSVSLSSFIRETYLLLMCSFATWTVTWLHTHLAAAQVLSWTRHLLAHLHTDSAFFSKTETV